MNTTSPGPYEDLPSRAESPGPPTAPTVPAPAAPTPPGGADTGIEPRVDESRVDEPRVDEPRVDEPRVDEPRVDESRVDEPRAGAPEAGRLAVEPLPYDGVASVAVGTVLWLVALAVMIPFAGDLEAAGRLWWLATAAVGSGLGLLGLVIVVRRRARLTQDSRNRL